MSARQHLRNSHAATTTAPVSWNWAADLTQPFAVATAGSAAVVRGLEAMRRIQEQAAQQALERHAQAAQKMDASAPPAALLAVQAELLRTDFSDATRCWQQLMGEAMEMNNELLGCAARMVNTEDVFAAARLLRA